MLKIGAIQLAVEEGKKETNLAHIEEMIQKNKNDGIELICFPELCISGYQFDVAKKSTNEDEIFSMLSAKYHVAIIAGICLHEDEKMYDAVGMWDEEGKCLGIYKKIHLWASENGIFEEGNQLPIIDFKGWKIGILICADLGFPEISTILTQKGCELIVYLSAWGRGPGFDELFTNCARVRAAENQIYVIALNRGDGDQVYCGYTTVAKPDGTALAFIGKTGEDSCSVLLKKDEIERVRTAIPWTSMKRKDLYEKLKEEK